VVFPLLAIAATFGPIAVAAVGVGRQVRALLNSFTWGFSIASSTLVGQALGRGDEPIAEAYGREITRLSAVVYVLVVAVVVAAARPIASVFVDGPADVDLATAFVRVAALSVLPLGVDGSVTGALRGAGDTRVPFVATMLGLYVVALPVAWLGTVTDGRERPPVPVGPLESGQPLLPSERRGLTGPDRDRPDLTDPGDRRSGANARATAAGAARHGRETAPRNGRNVRRNRGSRSTRRRGRRGRPGHGARGPPPRARVRGDPRRRGSPNGPERDRDRDRGPSSSRRTASNDATSTSGPSPSHVTTTTTSATRPRSPAATTRRSSVPRPTVP
jgi:hypothetical protein